MVPCLTKFWLKSAIICLNIFLLNSYPHVVYARMVYCNLLMQQTHESKTNMAWETKHQGFGVWSFQTLDLNNQLVDSVLRSLLCTQFKAGKPRSLQITKGLSWRISLFPLCSMLSFWLLPCQTKGWWIVMVIFVADELFCGRILVLLLLFIICWVLATCFHLKKDTLHGETSLSAYAHEFALPSTSNSSKSSFLCEFLHEEPLEEWCLDGEIDRDSGHRHDQAH